MSQTSWYRRYVWNYKGNREYTKSGYEAAKARFQNDMEVDCAGRHYVITGSNGGIGLEIAREVAKRGGVVHMVCRNRDSATKARSDIITSTGNDKIFVHTVDLSHPREVARWACGFAASQDKVDVLVNNAGCMLHDRIIDEDGIEANFAVNTLAVHILTTSLLPLIQKSEDGRVVTVSSAGMLCVKLDPYDLMHQSMEPWNGRLVYSQNKRQQVVMTLWYAQRYHKVHFSSMHPGWADTLAVRTSIPEFYEVMKDNLRTPGEGADTAVWLAISKTALTNPSGLFFQDRESVSMHLPLAWTKSTVEDEDLFMAKVEELYQKIIAPQPREYFIKPEQETTENGQQANNSAGIPESHVQNETISEAPAATMTEVASEAFETQLEAKETVPQPPVEKVEENLQAPVASISETSLQTQQSSPSDKSPSPVSPVSEPDTKEIEKELETSTNELKAPIASMSEFSLLSQPSPENTNVEPKLDVTVKESLDNDKTENEIQTDEVETNTHEDNQLLISPDLPKAPVASMSEFSLLSSQSVTSPIEPQKPEEKEQLIVKPEEDLAKVHGEDTKQEIHDKVEKNTESEEDITVVTDVKSDVDNETDDKKETVDDLIEPDNKKFNDVVEAESKPVDIHEFDEIDTKPTINDNTANQVPSDESQKTDSNSSIAELISFDETPQEKSQTDLPKAPVASMSDFSLGSQLDSNYEPETVSSSIVEDELSTITDTAPVSSVEDIAISSSPDVQSLPASNTTNQSESMATPEGSPSLMTCETTSSSPLPQSLSFTTDDSPSTPAQTRPIADVHGNVSTSSEDQDSI